MICQRDPELTRKFAVGLETPHNLVQIIYVIRKSDALGTVDIRHHEVAVRSRLPYVSFRLVGSHAGRSHATNDA